MLAEPQSAQAPPNEETYRFPLDNRNSISGAFGEVRSRHFHGGIDFRTGAVEGRPVRAAAKGMVVRISVSTTGYGRAVYIAHSDGTQTVYAHLRHFRADIDRWVRGQLYKRRASLGELYPPRGLFPVEAGDTVAFSGNTGSSGGPHLHFETRQRNGTMVVNPALYGIKPSDVTPPTITQLALYRIDTLNLDSTLAQASLHAVKGQSGKYRMADTIEVPAGQPIGLGVLTQDHVNRESLSCGTSSVSLQEDPIHRLLYHFDGQRFLFSENGYTDGVIDYSYRMRKGGRIPLLFRLPGCKLSNVQCENDGHISLRDGEIRSYTITVDDFSGNTSTLSLTLRGKALGKTKGVGAQISGGQQSLDTMCESNLCVDWYRECTIDRDGARLHLPTGTLMYSCSLRISKTPETTTHAVSRTYSVHSPTTPTKGAMSLTLQDTTARTNPETRYYLARMAKGSRGRTEWSFISKAQSLGANRYTMSLRSFGTYAMLLDTVGPRIDTVQMGNWCKQWHQAGDTLMLKISDAQTPIGRIDGLINNRWILWEMEPKRGIAWYVFDPSQIECLPNEKLYLRVEVRDAVGNVSAFSCPFLYKN